MIQIQQRLGNVVFQNSTDEAKKLADYKNMKNAYETHGQNGPVNLKKDVGKGKVPTYIDVLKNMNMAKLELRRCGDPRRDAIPGKRIMQRNISDNENYEPNLPKKKHTEYGETAFVEVGQLTKILEKIVQTAVKNEVRQTTKERLPEMEKTNYTYN